VGHVAHEGEKCIQNFSQKIWRVKNIWKTWAHIGEQC